MRLNAAAPSSPASRRARADLRSSGLSRLPTTSARRRGGPVASGIARGALGERAGGLLHGWGRGVLVRAQAAVHLSGGVVRSGGEAHVREGAGDLLHLAHEAPGLPRVVVDRSLR